MRVALFLKDEKIEGGNPEVIPIIILHLSNNMVVEVEKDIIVKKDASYISLWLLTKHIKEMYVMDIDPTLKQLFEKLGVVVRKHQDIKKNPLLRDFIA